MEEKDTDRDLLDRLEEFSPEREASASRAIGGLERESDETREADASRSIERDARLLFGAREAFAVRSPHVRPDAERAWAEFRRAHMEREASASRGARIPFLRLAARRKLILAPIAAALLILVGWQWLGGVLSSTLNPTLREATARGETRELRLADGTTVWLGASSSLAYPESFNGESREVELRGEAYFKVAHDARHPFLVHAGELTTRVLGTEFYARSRTGVTSSVTLIRGSVAVETNTRSREADASRSGGRALRLRPGQEARLLSDGSLAVGRVDTDRYTMWRDGYFFFDNESVGDIAARLADWYGLPLELRASRPALARRVHLVARRDSSAAEALRLLSVVGQVRARQNGGKIVIDNE